MLIPNWMAWKQNVLPIGVDIRHDGVRMVQLACGDGGLKVLAVERAPVTEDASRDSEQWTRSVVSAIRQLLSRGRFQGRKCVSSLSAGQLEITSLRLAEAEIFQADKSLRREAAQRFGLDPDHDAIEYLLAGSVQQGDEMKNEYIVLVAAADTIDRHIRLLEAAGLQPVGIDAAPCALLRSFERAMRREEDRQRTMIFMDIGSRDTTVVFGRNGEICLAKQMPFGTTRCDEEIASRLEMTVAEAASLRLRLRQDGPTENCTRHLATEALVAATEQLARELSLCLRYHTVTFRGRRIERAVVAGEGAYEPVLLDVLRRHLSIKVEPADPLRGVEPAATGPQRDGAHASADLAVAVGLSLKGQIEYALSCEPFETVPEPALETE